MAVMTMERSLHDEMSEGFEMGRADSPSRERKYLLVYATCA